MLLQQAFLNTCRDPGSAYLLEQHCVKNKTVKTVPHFFIHSFLHLRVIFSTTYTNRKPYCYIGPTPEA
jgi:hypothetical protein